MENINLMTVREFAEAKGCSTQTVLRWIKQGILSAHKVGTVYLIPPEEVERVSPRRRGRPKREDVIRQIVREELERLGLAKPA
jgi:excisionase family DNA binding protein